MLFPFNLLEDQKYSVGQPGLNQAMSANVCVCVYIYIYIIMHIYVCTSVCLCMSVYMAYAFLSYVPYISVPACDYRAEAA